MEVFIEKEDGYETEQEIESEFNEEWNINP